jgi:hypothetical protein
MAAANTNDTRTHVMGDLLMVTGTFTDGGLDYHYGDQLTNVLASGGHYTSQYTTGLLINNGAGYALAEAGALAVDGTDCRLHFNVGETLYTAAGARLGAITAIGSATALTVGGGLLAAVVDDQPLNKLGAFNPAITLADGQLDIAIDETNKFVVIGQGNVGAASTASTGDGRWWILGTR